jgi:hypothetical protein
MGCFLLVFAVFINKRIQIAAFSKAGFMLDFILIGDQYGYTGQKPEFICLFYKLMLRFKLNSNRFRASYLLLTACVGWAGALAETRQGRPKRRV